MTGGQPERVRHVPNGSGWRSASRVLLDVLLPGRDGFAMLEEMRHAVEEAPPVVIMSNDGEQAVVDRGLSLGAPDYLVESRVTPVG